MSKWSNLILQSFYKAGNYFTCCRTLEVCAGLHSVGRASKKLTSSFYSTLEKQLRLQSRSLYFQLPWSVMWFLIVYSVKEHKASLYLVAMLYAAHTWAHLDKLLSSLLLNCCSGFRILLPTLLKALLSYKGHLQMAPSAHDVTTHFRIQKSWLLAWFRNFDEFPI